MATRAELRIGDAEREAGAASLREHFAEGRLSLDEFNERLDAMLTARTQGQLDQITSDLPHVRTPRVPLPVPAGRGDVDAQSRVGMVAGLVAVLAIWFFLLVPTLVTHSLFEAPGRFPLLLIGLLVIRSLSRRIFGGRSRWDGGAGHSDWHDGHDQYERRYEPSRQVKSPYDSRYSHGGQGHRDQGLSGRDDGGLGSSGSLRLSARPVT